MINILGKKENLELFNKDGKRVYEFYTNSNGFSYEYTYDSFGHALTFKDSEGYSDEYTRDNNGNELTYKDSDGIYKIKGKKVTKQEFEAFIKPIPELTMEKLTKLLGYDFKLIK